MTDSLAAQHQLERLRLLGRSSVVGADIKWAVEEIERLTKALRIAELKASGTLANNLCPDHRDKQTGRPCLACEIERLRAALTHSVSVIQTWHNMGVPEKQRSDLWDIYWRNAPELKQIREAPRGDTP